jgi:predicted TIM-barrel fold metal-dependent hydrolase
MIVSPPALSDEFPQIDVMLSTLPVDVVFGHLGYVKTEKGFAAPGFQALWLLRGGRAWVKFTGPYRISFGTLPHADTNEFAHALLEAAPDRMVWRWRVLADNPATLYGFQ